MRIAVLSRGAQLYSTRSIIDAGIRKGHTMKIVDHAKCSLIMESGQPQVWHDGQWLASIDGVIPRIGASVTNDGANVIRQFEASGVYSLTGSNALLQSRDKLQSLQLLSGANIPIPKTAYVKDPIYLKNTIKQVGGLPVVIKLLNSTHGIGVVLAETMQTATSVVEAFLKANQPVIIQEFIKEAKGSDIRAFVVGRKVVASMMRTAAEGEFRSNLHRGATAQNYPLTEEEEALILKTTKILGLEVAGVDLLPSEKGALVMEVNASPGLEGIETTTGIDIAGEMIDWMMLQMEEFYK